ncbi:uncharacterized protein [Ptychodera flava]|uniref:uncharacterized protein n=1 Tax=Ptychodera flava TaxID=63121 RepID=UPI003969F0C1
METMADVNPKSKDETSGDTNEYQIISIQSQKVGEKEEIEPERQAEQTSEEGSYTDTLDEPKHEYASLSISSMEITAVPVADFKKVFTDAMKQDKHTLKSRLEREWQKLNEVSYQPKSGECRTGRLPQNLGKNRFPDILPIDRYRPQLSTQVQDPNATDYINASFLDGYNMKNAYLITQMPLPHTVVDFWRMVYDHKVRTIIMLNDADCDKSIRSKYWPDDGHNKYIGPFEVKLNKVKQNGLVTERAMTVSMTSTCHCVNDCDRATGECNSGGYSCSDGFYGELCEYKCHCKDNAACGKITGECSNGQCAPGWVNVNITDCQQDGSPTIWSLYNTKVNPGEQSSIVCTLSANPVLSPDDVTLVDQSGSPVTRTSHYVTGIYLSTSNYSSVTVDHGLTFTCSVSDHSNELTTLNLYALPRFSELNAPVVTAGTFHATVTWQKWEKGIDFGDGPVESYSVYYIKTRASGDWNLHRKFPVTDQDQTVYSTDITGLDWSTTYNFTVTVKRPGSKGEGSKETITKATTQCAEPTQGPTIKSVTSTDPTKIVVEFEVPDPYAIRCDSGFIRNFHVKFRKANQPDGYTEREIDDGTARSLTVDRLMAYTEYEIMLAFWNRNYLSPWSLPFSITTAESVPTKPRNVTLWPAVYAMEVSWSIPDPANGVVLKYTIAYWRTGEASSRQEEEFTENLRDVNTHVISNLTFRVLYSVQVQAFTSKGPGSYSDVASAETIETVPRIPSDLAVRDVTDTSMELSWSPPYPFSGAIIKYGVWYEATRSVFKDTLMKSVTLFLEGTDNSLSMEDLSPATLYKIGVNASTAKGFGDRATALIWTEFNIDISEVLPRKEANTKFVVKNDNSVEVTLLHPHKDSEISEDTTLIEYIIVLDHDKVTDTRRKRSIDTLQLGEYSDKGPTYYITASIPLQDLPETFIIGDGAVYGGYTNVPLTTGGQYDVYYGLKSNISTELMYHLDDIPALSFTARLPTPKTRSSPTGAIVGGILTVVFIVCAVIVAVFIVRRRRLRQDHESPQQDEVELNKKSKRTKENQVYSNEQVTMEKMADVNPKAQDENSGDTNEYQL